MDLLKSVTGKVVAGIIALAVIAGGISWWQMDPSTRQALLSDAGRLAAWAGIVLVAPWASCFVTIWIARRQSNAAGAGLVAGYTIIEAVLLMWLFGWHVPGATAWTFFVVGILLAGVYNLLTCDWIAEKLGEG